MKTNEKIVDLVAKVKAGDSAAFNDLYNESYKYLHTCVINIVKDEDAAMDMLQDAYVEIFKYIGQLKDNEGFLGWAATIANRKCFAYLKKNKDMLVDANTDDEGNETDYFETIADDEAFIPENVLDDREKINIIRGIIDELSDVQRACIIGFFYNEQKQDEIAKELGIPVNTVKSHLNRAKAKIKEAVGDTEKKQGIKLYSVAPFMLLFFTKDAESFAAKAAVPAMSAKVCGVVGNGTASGSTVSLGAKAVGGALKTKAIAAAAAGVVVIGGIAGLVIYNGSKEAPKASTFETSVEMNLSEENLSEVNLPEDNLLEETVSVSEEVPVETDSKEPEAIVEEIESSKLIKIVSEDETEYEYFGNGYGGVLIVKKDELFGAVDYEMNEIVPCMYKSFKSANNSGYFVLSDETQKYLFSPKGEMIFSTSDNLRTMAGGYATSANWSWEDEEIDTTINYYDYDGNFLAKTDMGGAAIPEIIGSHDSCILLKRVSDEGDNHVLEEVGQLKEDGSVTWKTEYDGPVYYDITSDTPNGNGASRGHHASKVFLSGLNDGYYLEYYGPGIEWGYFDLYDADCNLISGVNICGLDSNGNYAESNYFSNDVRGYYYDGCYFYNRGTKIIVTTEDTNILYDAMNKETLAVYDYISFGEDDLWLVQKGDQFGYINPEGTEVAMYDDACSFYNGYALVIKDGIASLIDTDLNVVEEIGEADSVSTYGELFVVKKNEIRTIYKLDVQRK